MTTEHEVRALVAERYAAAADDATAREDDRAMMAAADKLLEVLDTLPIRKPSGGGHDGSGGERGTLLELVDGPPEMGNASHS